MPTQKPQVLLTVDDELLKRIEDYRYGNRIPSRSKAMRKLIRIALDTLDKKNTDSEEPH